MSAALKLLIAASAIMIVPIANGADPVVSNVRAIQMQDGAGAVRITYDIAADTGSALHIGVEASSDGGLTWTVPMSTQSLSGNGYGAAVSAGLGKVISWDAVADWPGKVTTAMRFRVTASDTPPAPAGMALIPAGSFEMGDSFSEGNPDELPVRSVYVSAFYMDKYEVSKALWDEVAHWAAGNGYDIDAAGGSGFATNHPVFSVTWFECVKWCNARSQKDGLTPAYTVSGSDFKKGTTIPDCNFSANGYRLPSEAEWEKAARGGLSAMRYPWGNHIDASKANYASNKGSTTPCGYYNGNQTPDGVDMANGYGLYDMAGNVFEWCYDWYGGYSIAEQTDPTGSLTGVNRVLRGNGWYNGETWCRVSCRNSGSPDYYYNEVYGIGFRCARSSTP